ncbi:uracil-DNA glycosylase family protein [Blastomonas sp.]|uniref:uracil-DNA glycosylase family protein n=1 Tax=Blastomonas sp. TaxID=1909299 RepID=UPI0035940ED8
MLTGGDSNDRLARSVIDWWQLAGVTWDYREIPNDWLADEPPARSPQVRQPIAAAPTTAKAPPPAPQMPRVILPDSLAEFQRMWTEGALGEDNGSGPCIAPTGPANAQIMVLTGSPEADDQGTVLSGTVGRLLKNIMAACGTDIEQVYRASFYPRVGLDRRVAAEQIAAWHRITMHHIALVQPQMLVIAGDETAKALLGHVPSQKPPILHFLNHGEFKIKTVATRRLNLMLHRSADEKRMAWQSLQLLLSE